MYKAMFLMAFYGFLRIGEMTMNSSSLESHCLSVTDIHSSNDSFTIVFRSHKHSVPGRNSKILVKKQAEELFCPVVHVNRYLKIRGSRQGNLFIHPIGTSVSRAQFTDILNTALSFIHLSPNYYKGHSFRIGSCTWHMEQGFTDSQLRTMGRWRSNAFLKYIRP